jgi:integrase
VSALRRTQVEDLVAKRAAKHPRSALDELQFLKRVLREARERGQRVDDAVLSIKPVKHTARRGRALTVAQLYELASWFPEHTSRLILIAGQVGARQSFWFNLTDDMLDLDGGTMPIPAELAKNRREHRVYLTDIEVKLFREQLLARAPGTRLVFPNPEGKLWDRSRFRDRVWTKSVEAAAKNDRKARDSEWSTFGGFTFHLLRHTAGSLMAVAGMEPAVAAERMGHTDGGALFLRTYRHLYEGEKRIHAERLQAHVLASLDEEGTAVPGIEEKRLNEAAEVSGRTWDRTIRPRPPHSTTFRRNPASLSQSRRTTVRPPTRPDRLSHGLEVVEKWSSAIGKMKTPARDERTRAHGRTRISRIPARHRGDVPATTTRGAG